MPTNNSFNLVPFEKSLNAISFEASISENIFSAKYTLALSNIVLFNENENSQLSKETGLWNHTCFELFLFNPINNHYIEFNFSALGKYQIFYFTPNKNQLNTNDTLREVFDLTILSHRLTKSSRQRIFEFSFSFKEMPSTIGCPHLKIGPTVILEDENQEKEYFALKHLELQPDFHNPNSYAEFKV